MLKESNAVDFFPLYVKELRLGLDYVCGLCKLPPMPL